MWFTVAHCNILYYLFRLKYKYCKREVKNLKMLKIKTYIQHHADPSHHLDPSHSPLWDDFATWSTFRRIFTWIITFIDC